MLDLQVIRPNPIVEAGGRDVCEIDSEPPFAKADAAAAAVDRLISAGGLIEEAVDDHDVRKHYARGPGLVDDLAGKPRRPSPEAIALVTALEGPCAIRERCRLRRLSVR